MEEIIHNLRQGQRVLYGHKTGLLQP